MCIKILPGWMMPREANPQRPTELILQSFKLRLHGKLQFEPPTSGVVVYENGAAFRPFRKVCVNENIVPSRFPVLVKVKFRFRNLPFWMNRLLSWIPVPLITAQPGFISKTWYQRPSASEFMGIYEFSSAESASNYWQSLPLTMMKRRAAKGTLQGEIITFSASQGRYVRETLV